MLYTIYKVTNLVNGKEYTGKHQTENPNDDYLGSGKNLKRAIEKHGIINFKKEVLFIFDTEDEMNAREAELVTEEYCARKDTYNLCPGGHGGWGYVNTNGLQISDKQKKVASDWMKQLNSTWSKEELCARSKKSHMTMKDRGTLFIQTNPVQLNTPEVVEKRTKTMREKGHQKGEKNSQYGKPRSEETKRKISETLKKKKSLL